MRTKPTKYTKRYVLGQVRGLLTSLTISPDIVYLGELISEKPYSMQRISEWAKMGGEISETIEKVKNILETRAVVGGLRSQLNSGITKFHLINNFDWRDKQEVEQHGSLTVNVVNYASSSVPAEGLSTSVPASDGRGSEKSGSGVASEVGEG